MPMALNSTLSFTGINLSGNSPNSLLVLNMTMFGHSRRACLWLSHKLRRGDSLYALCVVIIVGRTIIN